MATTPTPTPTSAAPVTTQADLHAALIALSGKHATVSYLTLGVLVVVLLLAAVGGYIGLKFADAQLARAEKQEQQYDADRKEWLAQKTADDATRAANVAKQQVIVKVVDTRDATANTAIQNSLRPDATVETVRAGLQASYSDLPSFGPVESTPDGNIAITKPQAQQLTATRIDQERLTLDLVDTKTALGLEQNSNSLLYNDLAKCTIVNVEGDKTITAYKKAAKVAKWKKVLHGAEIGGAIAVAIFTGYKLGSLAGGKL